MKRLNATQHHPQPIRGSIRPVTDDLITKFIEHAHSAPNKIAIMTTTQAITYQQLYWNVIYWKTQLSQTHHSKIIICLERTPELLSLLLAMQWLGITYIPVDPSIPIERLRSIIHESQAHALVYDAATHPHFDGLSCDCLDIQTLNKTQPTLDETYPPKRTTTAYIIFTSGSTGKPKGVAIAYSALHNFLASMSGHFLQEASAMALAITTVAFDIAVLELYLPLWQQKTVFLANQMQHKDPLSLAMILNQYPITLLQTTSSFWSMLLASEWTSPVGLVALCGGEPLTQTLAGRLLEKVTAVWNMYGPTEATVWCALKHIQPDTLITVGRPIPNIEMRVMDAQQRILPPYIKGELFIGGIGLAEGYVNNPELTREKFISCPNALSGRLYRVGDLACTTAEGEFIIFGRTDNQIKLHGYRIELEDIEAHMQTFPGVRESAVEVSHEQLIAYLCLDAKMAFSQTVFIDYLKTHLPEYMIPKRIVLLDTLPKSLSGKIDRKALPTPSITTSQMDTVSTLTPLQLSLKRIWSEELALDTVNLHDNFFELGGHSLLAARIIVKIAHQFGKRINLSDFYHAPTIAEFVHILEQTPLEERHEATLATHARWLPLHDFQFILWVSRIFEPKLRKFNVAKRKRIQGPLNKKALDSALQLVLQKQAILTYKIHRFYPIQTQRSKVSLTWSEHSLLDYADEAADTYLAQSFDYLFYKKTWPTHAPRVFAAMYHLNHGHVELHICLSHLIADEYSLSIFFHELSNAYLFFAHNALLNVQDSSQSYKHYIAEQNAQMHQHATSDAAFWYKYLKDAGLFYIPQRYVAKQAHSASTHIPLSEVFQSKLRQFCMHHHVTLNDVLCAAISLALFQCCDNNERCLPHELFINTVKSTRDNPHFDNIVGCFLRIHPVKLRVNPQQTLLSLAKQAQQSTLETTPYQRASGLIKLAAIGQLPAARKPLKKWLISLALSILSKCSPKFNYDKSILRACTTLAIADRSKQFLINLNILNNFLDNTHEEHALFGRPNQPIPLHPYPIHIINYMIDIFIHRSNDHNIPFLVITANLTSEFQQRLGDTLISIVESS